MIWILQFLSFSRLLLYEKWIPSILIVLVFRFTHSIPQRAIWTLFRTPIPAILNLNLFDFNPEKNEKCSKTCITSVTGFLLLRKKVVSWAYAVYKKWLLKMVRPWKFSLSSTKKKTISKTRIKKYAKIGSP